MTKFKFPQRGRHSVAHVRNSGIRASGHPGAWYVRVLLPQQRCPEWRQAHAGGGPRRANVDAVEPPRRGLLKLDWD